uniref:Pectate lyase n=1 Tax=Oryza rufipogon TaxID=4529 RepID=A0A0E0PTF3_ORYRU
MAASSVTGSRRLCILFYLLTVVATVVTAASAHTAHNATADEEYWEKRAEEARSFNRAAYEYWEKRAEEARSFNRAAYVSDPVATLNRFNADVLRATTRRSLARYTGPCMATNPIDRCWRCRDDWATDRKRLARCVRGFGHRTVGGAAGKIYVVTDASDDEMVIPRKGTLRYGVIQDRPMWIVFARDMIIQLRQELIVNHNKTIDGRGAQVHITGAQITLQGVQHVIIHNVHIHHSVPHGGGMIRDSKRHYGLRTRSDGDGISIMSSSNIWIDHVSMSNCSDGLIDAGNRFIAPDDLNAKEVTKREYTPYDEYKEWVWKSQGDVMMNGAFFNESGGQNERSYDQLDFIPAKHGKYVGQLTKFAGTLNCHVGMPC